MVEIYIMHVTQFDAVRGTCYGVRGRIFYAPLLEESSTPCVGRGVGLKGIKAGRHIFIRLTEAR